VTNEIINGEELDATGKGGIVGKNRTMENTLGAESLKKFISSVNE
jgi:hypothetical protein